LLRKAQILAYWNTLWLCAFLAPCAQTFPGSYGYSESPAGENVIPASLHQNEKVSRICLRETFQWLVIFFGPGVERASPVALGDSVVWRWAAGDDVGDHGEGSATTSRNCMKLRNEHWL